MQNQDFSDAPFELVWEKTDRYDSYPRFNIDGWVYQKLGSKEKLVNKWKSLHP